MSGNGRGIRISREDLERWAGRPLHDAEVAIIESTVAATGIPAEIRAMAEFMSDDDQEASTR